MDHRTAIAQTIILLATSSAGGLFASAVQSKREDSFVRGFFYGFLGSSAVTIAMHLF